MKGGNKKNGKGERNGPLLDELEDLEFFAGVGYVPKDWFLATKGNQFANAVELAKRAYSRYYESANQRQRIMLIHLVGLSLRNYYDLRMEEDLAVEMFEFESRAYKLMKGDNFMLSSPDALLETWSMDVFHSVLGFMTNYEEQTLPELKELWNGQEKMLEMIPTLLKLLKRNPTVVEKTAPILEKQQELLVDGQLAILHKSVECGYVEFAHEMMKRTEKSIACRLIVGLDRDIFRPQMRLCMSKCSLYEKEGKLQKALDCANAGIGDRPIREYLPLLGIKSKLLAMAEEYEDAAKALEDLCSWLYKDDQTNMAAHFTAIVENVLRLKGTTLTDFAADRPHILWALKHAGASLTEDHNSR
jgi:hypothetical protein